MSDIARGYVRSINSLQQEINRSSEHLSKLRNERKKTYQKLYDWMERNNVEEVEGIKKTKVKPKTESEFSRKKKKDKVKDGINLFRDVGLPDPEGFYFEFQQTQKLKKQ